MRTELVLDALRMPIHQRGAGADVELVAHTGRGSQYTSMAYTEALQDAGILASVGSVGDAYDNARAESFVDSFQDRADRRSRNPVSAEPGTAHMAAARHDHERRLGDASKSLAAASGTNGA